ncbi:MAG: MarR family winged helix-turn-helix transcriptional regulator [Pseudomonadota bacterium]
MGSKYMGAKLNRRALPAKPASQSETGQASDVRDVLNALRRIVRSLRVSSRTAEQRVGLSGAQLFVLQCLARHSPCSVNELAERTATDQSSVSVVVSRLVARGYVRRVPSKVDRRRVELTLEKSGRALLESAPQAAQDRLIYALGELAKTELKALARSLDKVVALAEVGGEAPSLFFEEGPVLAGTKGRASRV